MHEADPIIKKTISQSNIIIERCNKIIVELKERGLVNLNVVLNQANDMDKDLINLKKSIYELIALNKALGRKFYPRR